MRRPKILLAVLFVFATAAAASEESFQGALQRGAAVHPSQYSFVDVYRVTVSGPGAAAFPVTAQDNPVRVATAQAPAQFAVAEAREPQLGLLLLSGIALAVWVARRRLGYGF
jgi:hypothetical protein